MVAPPLAKRGVVVKVDQPGHDDLPGGIDVPSVAIRHRDIAAGDLSDTVALDHNCPTEVNLIVIVERHHGAVSNYQSIAHAFLSVLAAVCNWPR
jgi:hypothetical protein